MLQQLQMLQKYERKTKMIHKIKSISKHEHKLWSNIYAHKVANEYIKFYLSIFILAFKNFFCPIFIFFTFKFILLSINIFAFAKQMFSHALSPLAFFLFLILLA